MNTEPCDADVSAALVIQDVIVEPAGRRLKKKAGQGRLRTTDEPLELLLVRYRWLFLVFGALFIVLSILDLAPKLADAAPDSFSDVPDSRRAEQDDDNSEMISSSGAPKLWNTSISLYPITQNSTAAGFLQLIPRDFRRRARSRTSGQERRQ